MYSPFFTCDMMSYVEEISVFLRRFIRTYARLLPSMDSFIWLICFYCCMSSLIDTFTMINMQFFVYLVYWSLFDISFLYKFNETAAFIVIVAKISNFSLFIFPFVIYPSFLLKPSSNLRIGLENITTVYSTFYIPIALLFLC